tara:strand:+ start:73 stop:609 length:537 start_codon:yes stop_codon:yes gene_type:complete
MNTPFSRPDLANFIKTGTDAVVSKVTFPDGTSQTTAATAAPTSIFGIDYFPRTFNADLDGLQYLTQLGPDPGAPLNPISFINLPFNYKIIGVSMSIDSDGGSLDYDFQIYERDANTNGGGAAVGDVLSFDDVEYSTSRSGLFNTPHSVTPSKDIALHLDASTTGNSGEVIFKIWCQTV